MLDSHSHNFTGLASVLKLRIDWRGDGCAMILQQRFTEGVKFVAPLVLSGTLPTDQPVAKFVGLTLPNSIASPGPLRLNNACFRRISEINF